MSYVIQTIRRDSIAVEVINDDSLRDTYLSVQKTDIIF